MICNGRRIIYLDNAASSFPKPPNTVLAVSKMLKNNTANAGRSGHRLSVEAAQAVFSARSAAAEFFGLGGHEESIVFTQNATHAINTVLFGLPLEGKHLIISDMEHNSVYRPSVYLSKQSCTLGIAEVSGDPEQTVENIAALITPKTALVFCTHASNVTGKRLPVREIGELCRRRGIIFAVDASQTAGHIPIDMNRDNIDILCTSGHKGLLGPQGTGLIAMNGYFPIKPLVYGGTGTGSLLAEQPPELPEALESGTLNAAALAGLRESLVFLKKYGNTFRKREALLYDKMYDGLRSLGVKLYSPKENNCGTAAFSVGDIHSDTVTALLDVKGICVRGGYHCSALCHAKLGTIGNGLVRASVNGFNTEKEIELFLEGIKEVLTGH